MRSMGCSELAKGAPRVAVRACIGWTLCEAECLMVATLLGSALACLQKELMVISRHQSKICLESSYLSRMLPPDPSRTANSDNVLVVGRKP